MALDLGTIMREALALWQNPSFQELPIEDQLAACNRSVRQLLIDFDMTPNASFLAVRSTAFSLNSSDAREKDLSGISDLSRPLRLESRGLDSTSDDDWTEWERSTFENWNDTMSRVGDFVAFYGTPPALKMIINRDASNEQFRLVYSSQLAEVTTTTDLVALPDCCKPYLVYDIALEYGELIDNYSTEFQKKKQSKMMYLLDRRNDAKKQIDRWRRSQLGSSVSTRRSFTDRAPQSGFRQRRFVVNF